MTQSFAFHRPTLAHRVADMALGLDPLAGDSGVFLAGPRRTGKSTFLKLDLIPELEKRNVLPVYVDLWTDRTADPGEVITEAIRSAIRTLARLSGLGQFRRLGPDKIKGIAEKVYTTASIGVAVTAAILGGGWGGSSRCIRLSKRRNSGSGSV